VLLAFQRFVLRNYLLTSWSRLIFKLE